MATEFDIPTEAAVTDKNGNMPTAWAQWFARVHRIILSVVQSGPTADRPTVLVWLGRRYFDTTLGKPVYVKSIGPIVWVDGAGAIS